MTNDQTIDQTEDDDAPLVAPGKARAEVVRRLQIGITGLFAMILLVSLASIIKDRANESEKTTVPDASASTAGETTPNKDPLADAGVVPELPAEPSAAPSAGAQAGNASARP
ncbi:MAG: hypothetical protein H6R45_427 [Proteobacteria bacterium]|nr:hypothetical protein [Pseudomonadota bacterium]